MVPKKFGLAELERYQREVGFKNGDVRTIKGVLAIVNIPNVVAQEATDAVNLAEAKVVELAHIKSAVKENDANDEAMTKEKIADVRLGRKARKTENLNEIAKCAAESKNQDNEIARLASILKKFS